jgi:purine-binding chemotaxis protein CheW
MKKKNKVENSLERLFSAKKNDLVNTDGTDEEKSQETAPEKKVADTTKKPKVKPTKAEKKEAKITASKKTKVEKQETTGPVESTSKLPVEEMKQPEPKVASPSQPAPKPEPPVDDKKSPSDKQETKSDGDNAKIDKPMTDAIVAHKANEYETDEHLVIFSLADQAYGISIMIVESIIKMQDITHVPRAHPAITGATNLRGVVLPVIDLCKKMGLPASEEEEAKRIIVVAVEDIMAGFIVDNVESVFRISSKEIAPPSPMVTSIDQKYIKGVAKNGEHGLVIILEPINIFESIISESAEIKQKKRIK